MRWTHDGCGCGRNKSRVSVSNRKIACAKAQFRRRRKADPLCVFICALRLCAMLVLIHRGTSRIESAKQTRLITSHCRRIWRKRHLRRRTARALPQQSRLVDDSWRSYFTELIGGDGNGAETCSGCPGNPCRRGPSSPTKASARHHNPKAK